MVASHHTSGAPTYAQHYVPRLLAYQDEMLAHLATLVNIDSGTGQIAGVNRIIVYLHRWMTELGFEVTLHPIEGFGNNLVAHMRGKGTARILLVGHVDTVYTQGAVQTQPFRIEDELVYGPGVIDMKSGVIMCIFALRVLLEEGFDQFGEIYVVFNNDEEIGSTGSAPLLHDIAKLVDVGLVLESSRSANIITKARKGADKYMLEVRGISAHSGAEPQKGRSAVVELAHKIIAINNISTLFYGVTCNVTRISSSEQLNMVPDLARCHISIRAYDERGLDMAADALQQIVDGCSVPDTQARLIRMPGRRPYQATPAMLDLLHMTQIEGTALGLSIVAEGKGGVSDANTLMAAGIPTLDSLGPIGGGMHNLEREYLRADSIALRGALLAGLLQRISLSKSTGSEPLP
ncbi:MAG: M20/M25/M40 family metallo-hydrolase [Ktedonobacteraceae bacterium]